MDHVTHHIVQNCTVSQLNSSLGVKYTEVRNYNPISVCYHQGWAACARVTRTHAYAVCACDFRGANPGPCGRLTCTKFTHAAHPLIKF